jgi:hypothetical protein
LENIILHFIFSLPPCKSNATVIPPVQPPLPTMAEPLYLLNDALNAYHDEDVESTQGINSSVNGGYYATEIEVQDQAISTMLEASGFDLDLLIALVRSFKAAEDAGHNRCLTTISSIPEEERLGRLKAASK